MFSKSYTSIGVVLSSREYSEADRLISVFTSDNGRLMLIAKGVRRLTSRKRGSLEMFSLIKFSARKSTDLDIITEVEIINSFDRIRQSLLKLSVAFFLVESVSKTTQPHEDHKEIFDILVKYLTKLELTNKLKTLRNDFTKELLTALGFVPERLNLNDSDKVLEDIAERKFASIRVGKKVTS